MKNQKQMTKRSPQRSAAQGKSVNAKAKTPQRQNQQKAKRVLSQVNKAENASRLSSVLTMPFGETQEDILCLVNPQIIQQYVCAVMCAPLAITDNPSTAQAVFSALYSVLINFRHIPEKDDAVVPYAIARLRKSLESRTIGKYSYTADWSAYDVWTTNLVSYGFNLKMCLDPWYAPTNTTSSGFYNANYIPSFTWALDDPEVTRIIGQYASYYNPVSYNKVKEDYGDASGFCFDVTNGRTQYDFQAMNVISLIGWDNTNTTNPLFIAQDGVWGLEVEPKRLDLASVRACTPVARPYGDSSKVTGVVTIRSPRRSGDSLGSPSIMGWASKRGGIKGRIMTKPVPGGRLIQSCVDRLEALISQLGGTTLTAWQNSFTSNQVKLIAYSWVANAMKRYAGAHRGMYINTNLNIGTSQTNTNLPAFSSEFWPNMYFGCITRIPQYVATLLGSIESSSNGEGTLIPMLGPQTLTTITTSLSYLTETVTLPAGAYAGTYGYASMFTIVNTYKNFEPLLATMESMMAYGSYGPSNLDTTILRQASATQLLMSILSRRPITDKLMYRYYAALPSITYDYGEDTNIAGPISMAVNSKVFGTRYRREVNGANYDLVSAAFNKEGIVVNGFVNNIGGLAPNWDPLARPQTGTDLVKDVPKGLQSYVSLIASRLVPRKGNYCGPGWTAGVETAIKDPPKGADGYKVPPTDEEDAICKRHDEAYSVLESSKEKAVADRIMVASLNALRKKKGLSLYGHGAMLALALKADTADPPVGVDPAY